MMERGPHGNERFALTKHTFQSPRGTAGTPQVTHEIWPCLLEDWRIGG